MAYGPMGAKPLPEPIMIYSNWAIGNKYQWNLNTNSTLFIQENTFENVICEKAAILPGSQCVKIRRKLFYCTKVFGRYSCSTKKEHEHMHTITKSDISLNIHILYEVFTLLHIFA